MTRTVKPNQQVFFFAANKSVDIMKAIRNDDSDMFVCYGNGDKAYRTACKNATDDQNVYQIKITTSGVQLLYTY